MRIRKRCLARVPKVSFLSAPLRLWSASLLLLAACGSTQRPGATPTTEPPPPVPQAAPAAPFSLKITCPKDRSTAPKDLDLEGTFAGALPPGRHGWVVVKATSGWLIYPKTPLELVDGATWHASLSLGSDDDNGKVFQVQVIHTNDQDHTILLEYMKRIAEQNPGLAPLPSTATLGAVYLQQQLDAPNRCGFTSGSGSP
jgi:hypothetical protein